MNNRINFLPPWVETNIQPAFYDKESGSCLQQTARMYAKVNQLVRIANEQWETIQDYINQFIDLRNYVEDYFENMNVQEEINNKLDAMAEDGSLLAIVAPYINEYTRTTNDRLNRLDQDITAIKNSYGTPITVTSSGSMTDTSKIYVYVGTTGGGYTNGHWYYHNGAQWVDGGVYQSAGIGNGTVNKDSLVTILKDEYNTNAYKSLQESTANLLNEQELKSGYYQSYDANVGAVINYYTSSRYKCVMLPVKPSTTYYITKLVHVYSEVDANGLQVARYGSSGTDVTDVTITTNANTRYLALDFRSSWTDIGVYTTADTTDYIQKYIKEAYIPQVNFGYYPYPNNATIELTSDDVLKLPKGFVVYNNQSREFNATNVNIDTTLADNTSVIVYDLDSKSVSQIAWKEINALNQMGGFTNKMTSRKVILGILVNRRFYINGSAPYSFTYKPLSVAFMGDSITAGNNCSKAYHMYLHDVTFQHCLNYGCGGTGFVTTYTGSSGKVGNGMEGVPNSTSSQSGNNTVGEIIDTVPETVTNFVVFAGTNDYGSNKTLADFSTAVQNVIDKLYTRSATFMFITPMRRKYNNVDGETANGVGLKLSDYVDKIIELCNANGVRYVDLYHNTSLNPNNASNKTAYVPDGLHPNNAGQKLLAEKVVDTFKNVFTDFK